MGITAVHILIDLDSVEKSKLYFFALIKGPRQLIWNILLTLDKLSIDASNFLLKILFNIFLKYL